MQAYSKRVVTGRIDFCGLILNWNSPKGIICIQLIRKKSFVASCSKDMQEFRKCYDVVVRVKFHI
jgi:hypothetical protein